MPKKGEKIYIRGKTVDGKVDILSHGLYPEK